MHTFQNVASCVYLHSTKTHFLPEHQKTIPLLILPTGILKTKRRHFSMFEIVMKTVYQTLLNFLNVDYWNTFK